MVQVREKSRRCASRLSVSAARVLWPASFLCLLRPCYALAQLIGETASRYIDRDRAGRFRTQGIRLSSAHRPRHAGDRSGVWCTLSCGDGSGPVQMGGPYENLSD